MKKPVEDYQTTLTEDQKKILDDAPVKVVRHLLDYVNENGMPPYFNLRVTDVVTGRFVFEKFDGVAAVNGIDYLKYLVRNGYKDLSNAG